MTQIQSKPPIQIKQVFGRWTVLRADKWRYWTCRCECGTERPVREDHLRTGDSFSCGCWLRERAAQAVTHGMTHTRTYKRWETMRRRCNNPNAPEYPAYGGSGITMCQAWNTFEQFFLDMGECPERMTLDRINTNGNYELSNCRWATPKQQGNNRRTNISVALYGRTQTVAEWCQEIGQKPSRAYARLKAGWPPEQALTAPCGPTGPRDLNLTL